ncbi:hypothetical protein DHOM_00765 [Dermabacter hominis 1368]|uniref:Uncharacterized protein n=3 Tax=Dermabacteraceae TaxID=85020 RepID=A0ABR4SNC9_9MICO|nr:hypothetical protein COP05_08650 [Dermabacter jinjuensis]KDS94522.1 hypothetical protein DHOM_00765 [Dermabacter hominis 1368]
MLEGASNWDSTPARTSRSGAFLKYLFGTGLGLAALSLVLSFLGLVCVVCSFVEPFERFGLGTLPLAALALVLAFVSVRLSQRQGGSVLLSFAAIAASFPLVFFGLTPYAFMFLMPVGKA